MTVQTTGPEPLAAGEHDDQMRAERMSALAKLYEADGPADLDEVTGPTFWPDLSPAEAREEWAALRAWVEQLIQRFGHLAPCHPPMLVPPQRPRRSPRRPAGPRAGQLRRHRTGYRRGGMAPSIPGHRDPPARLDRTARLRRHPRTPHPPAPAARPRRMGAVRHRRRIPPRPPRARRRIGGLRGG